MHRVPEANVSLWSATTPESDFPALQGSISVDVAVVGGGVTGLTAATLLAAAGARVALVEARHIATGTTGNTTAKVTSLHRTIYASLIERFGEEQSQLYADANQAALERIVSLAQERSIECELRRLPAYTYASSAEGVSEIQAEVEAARRLGLPASYTEDVPLALGARAAVRFERQLAFHPRKYCLGLAASLAAEGAQVFERTRVKEVLEDGPRLVVRAEEGRIDADHVIIATLQPFTAAGGFFAKTYPSRSYALAARVEGAAPEGMFLSLETPTRSVRPGPAGDEALLVIEGEEHKTGQDDETRERYAALEAWARETFTVRSVEHRWSAQDYMSPDRVPYVGRASSDSPRLLVATGFGKWGLSNGTAAAMMLSELALGRESPWLSLFDATRLKPGTSTVQLVKENLDVAKRFIGDRLSRLVAPTVEQLAPGEGALVRHKGQPLAAYRDQHGELYALSASCTHLGCLVAWNSAERSWDCPCHGSRFDFRGRVLEGPAVEPLEREPLTQD